MSSNRRTTRVMDEFSCEVCKVVSSVLELYLERGDQEEDIVKLMAKLCILFGIETDNVCNLAVEEFKVP